MKTKQQQGAKDKAMAAQVEQLDRDAMLLLYLAEEMPLAERQAFEQRLAGDAELAAELAALRAAQEVSFAAIAHADRANRLPVGEGVAVRRVSRAIQQWQTRRVKPAEDPRRRGLLLPWWCYPAAAAASIITAFLVWSSRQEVGPTDPVVAPNQYVDSHEQDLADLLDSSLAFDESGGAAAVDALIGGPLSPGREDDLNSVFLIPPSEETIQ